MYNYYEGNNILESFISIYLQKYVSACPGWSNALRRHNKQLIINALLPLVL